MSREALTSALSCRSFDGLRRRLTRSRYSDVTANTGSISHEASRSGLEGGGSSGGLADHGVQAPERVSIGGNRTPSAFGRIAASVTTAISRCLLRSDSLAISGLFRGIYNLVVFSRKTELMLFLFSLLSFQDAKPGIQATFRSVRDMLLIHRSGCTFVKLAPLSLSKVIEENEARSSPPAHVSQEPPRPSLGPSLDSRCVPAEVAITIREPLAAPSTLTKVRRSSLTPAPLIAPVHIPNLYFS